MAGEMNYIDPHTGADSAGNVWSLHAALARGVGGELKPFDLYQGPYVAVGPDLRVGEPPYDMPVQGFGLVRLWIGEDDEGAYVYREDTDRVARFPLHCGDLSEALAVEGAQSLLAGGGEPVDRAV